MEPIHAHEERNDVIRRHGTDKRHGCNHAETPSFVELCHRNGLKIIPYLSASRIHKYGPHFRGAYGADMHYAYTCANAGGEYRSAFTNDILVSFSAVP